MIPQVTCYYAALVVIIAYSAIVSVKGQCTIGSYENGDSAMNIVAEIQQQSARAFGQLNIQVQGINKLLNASVQEMRNQHDAIMRSQPMNIVAEIQQQSAQAFSQLNIQVQGINKLLNASVQEMRSQHDSVMRSQHDAILRSLQAIDQRLREHDVLIKNQIQNSRIIANVWDCSDIKASGQTTNGVYEVCVGHQLNRVCTNAFCDMSSTNGPWMVFQRRINGSVDFYRTWNEYKNGFGAPNGEFWLGNEVLYLLTSKRNYKLRIDLEDFEGRRRFAEYSRFSISSSADNYRLAVGGFSGDAGDCLKQHNGLQFSTKDVDNDNSTNTNCANFYQGAWWFLDCYHSNLNGVYLRGNYSDSGTEAIGIQWNCWPGQWYSLKSTEMKLVPLA